MGEDTHSIFSHSGTDLGGSSGTFANISVRDQTSVLVGNRAFYDGAVNSLSGCWTAESPEVSGAPGKMAML